MIDCSFKEVFLLPGRVGDREGGEQVQDAIDPAVPSPPPHPTPPDPFLCIHSDTPWNSLRPPLLSAVMYDPSVDSSCCISSIFFSPFFSDDNVKTNSEWWNQTERWFLFSFSCILGGGQWRHRLLKAVVERGRRPLAISPAGNPSSSR
jgi:hypothetical protein